ncbi:MAG: YbaN family protein [Phycisphaerales bacterium JB039]
MTTAASLRSSISPRRVQRWLLAGMGVACVGLGGAGVVIPGLPTTVFLLIATWCFTRSCPWLEDKLIRNRFFAPFLGYLDRSRPMPRRAKVAAMGMMWLFVALAAFALWGRPSVGGWLCGAVALAAVVGTVVIVRWDAPQRRSALGR